jgi:chromosome partitioning related protein ParA
MSDLKILTLFNTKGGVGKTSTAGNLGACIADMGKRVLLIDADQQQSLTAFFTVQDDGEPRGGLVQLVQTQDPTNCIRKTDIDNLDIVISNDINNLLAPWLSESASRMSALKVALRKLASDYDYVIIDTAGVDGTGGLQELAVRAATQLLILVSPDAVVAREFLTNSLNVLNRMRPFDPADTYNAIPIPHVLLYRYVPNSRSHTAYIEGLRGRMAEMEQQGLLHQLEVMIPQVVAYNDAQSVGEKQPVHRYERIRRGATPSAYECMTQLAHQLFPELDGLMPRISATEPFPKVG